VTEESDELSAADLGGTDHQRVLSNLAAYVRWHEERAKRKQVEAEADSWRAEALSHRRRLGIPAGGAYARFARPEDRAQQTSEPNSGPEDETKGSIDQ